jgi:hypothetical protein
VEAAQVSIPAASTIFVFEFKNLEGCDSLTFTFTTHTQLLTIELSPRVPYHSGLNLCVGKHASGVTVPEQIGNDPIVHSRRGVGA